jgi:hypothetical protein
VGSTLSLLGPALRSQVPGETRPPVED